MTLFSVIPAFPVIPAFSVIPAKAGIHADVGTGSEPAWIPASAGMTARGPS